MKGLAYETRGFLENLLLTNMKTKYPLRVLLVLSMVVFLGLVMHRLTKPKTSARTIPAIEIQDGVTIDFSTGKPVIVNTPQNKAAIATAVKEIDEAVTDVKFKATKP